MGFYILKCVLIFNGLNCFDLYIDYCYEERNVYCLTLPHFRNCSNPGSRFSSPTVIVISVFTSLRFTRGVASIVVVDNLCCYDITLLINKFSQLDKSLILF